MQPWLASENKEDGEPKGHAAGVTSSAQIGSNANAKWYTNGNGSGNEKWDAFEEIARFSKDQD